jgi:hypothetical protein
MYLPKFKQFSPKYRDVNYMKNTNYVSQPYAWDGMGRVRP